MKEIIQKEKIENLVSLWEVEISYLRKEAKKMRKEGEFNRETNFLTQAIAINECGLDLLKLLEEE